MNVFREFEKKLEGLFEGVFLRAFKTGVHPVEIGKKLIRELEDNKAIGVSRIYAPNRFEVGLSSREISRFESFLSVLSTELENLLISYIREKGYVVVDRPRVVFEEATRLKSGEFSIRCWVEGEMPEAKGGAKETRPAGARGVTAQPFLELMDSGEVPPTFPVEKDEVFIGRLQTNDVVLPDPNVSRVHAKIVRRNDSFFIVDLESRNGTWLNDRRVVEEKIKDGDLIRFGSTTLVFRRPPK